MVKFEILLNCLVKFSFKVYIGLLGPSWATLDLMGLRQYEGPASHSNLDKSSFKTISSYLEGIWGSGSIDAFIQNVPIWPEFGKSSRSVVFIQAIQNKNETKLEVKGQRKKSSRCKKNLELIFFIIFIFQPHIFSIK